MVTIKDAPISILFCLCFVKNLTIRKRKNNFVKKTWLNIKKSNLPISSNKNKAKKIFQNILNKLSHC